MYRERLWDGGERFLSCCDACILMPAPRGSPPSHSLPFRLCRHAGPMPADVMETVVLAGAIHVRTELLGLPHTKTGLFFLTLPPRGPFYSSVFNGFLTALKWT